MRDSVMQRGFTECLSDIEKSFFEECDQLDGIEPLQLEDVELVEEEVEEDEWEWQMALARNKRAQTAA